MGTALWPALGGLPLQAAALLALAIAQGPALACAAPVQYYSGGGPLPERSEAQRGRVLEELRHALAESHIERLELEGLAGTQQIPLEHGDSPSLAQLPLAVLQAAALTGKPQERGAEYDWIAPRTAQPPGALIRVRHDLDRRLRLVVGAAPQPLGGSAPSAHELRERYGIGPLLENGARWRASERRALGAALSLLTPAERAYLKDLPFRREQNGEDEDEAGYYSNDEDDFEGGLITLFNATFEDDDDTFVGTPQHTYPRSVDVILHEIGHAIAQLDQEQLIAARERGLDHYNEMLDLSDEYSDDLDAREELAERLRHRSERHEAQAQIDQLETNLDHLDSRLEQARRQLRELDRRIDQASPMEQAYAALPDARRGPTPYAKTSVIEGFAESFSLFHLDPESLSRFSPEIRRWFQDDRHLAASHFSPPAGGSLPAGASGAHETESSSKPQLEL